MRDYVDIGCTPWEERCAQTTEPDFRARAQKEALVYKAQILRQFGLPPDNVEIRLAWNRHDFGAYPELRIYFEDEAGADWAYNVEGNTPPRWDEESLLQLPPPMWPTNDRPQQSLLVSHEMLELRERLAAMEKKL